MDIERAQRNIRIWLSEPSDSDDELEKDERQLGEEAGLDEGIEEQDEQQFSDHQTDSENEAGEAGNSVFVSDARVPYVLGKDAITKWRLHSFQQNRIRTRQHNVVTEARGLKGNARNAFTPIEAWKIFFPDEVINDIVTHTNRLLAKIRPNFSRERDCNETNSEELLSFFGLLYYAGLLKSSHLDLFDLWQKTMMSPSIFRMVMSVNRFKLLLRALRFDNIEDRLERRQTDKVAPIRELFQGFVERCMASYKPGTNCTIDEMLARFFGRCPFRQYIPSKPDRYGIKIFSIVDSETYFTLKMEIYAGTQPEGPYSVDNSPSAVVKRMIEPIDSTGRNITCDNWFTSVTLARDLMQNHRTTIVGTIRKNRREIPEMVTQTRQMPEKSSLFVFADRCTLVSYVPKKNRNVLLLSTMHHDDQIDPSSGDNNKPEIITYYNKTKGGVDVVDQKRKQYSVKRVCNRWPLAIFFTLMDIATINSHIIYHMNTNAVVSRRSFIKQLAKDLVENQLRTRMENPALRPDLRSLIKMELSIQEPPREVRNEQVQREKCQYCPRMKNRKTKVRCASCGAAICSEHTVTTCTGCRDDNEHPQEYYED